MFDVVDTQLCSGWASIYITREIVCICAHFILYHNGGSIYTLEGPNGKVILVNLTIACEKNVICNSFSCKTSLQFSSRF